MPLANAYLDLAGLDRDTRPSYPLHARVCDHCLLVQVEASSRRRSCSATTPTSLRTRMTWVDHARRFAAWAVGRLELGRDSLVVEVASNDGYLLQHFVSGRRPGARRSNLRRTLPRWPSQAGIPTEVAFFGVEAAAELVRAAACRPTCWWPTTCSPTFPTSTTSWPGYADWHSSRPGVVQHRGPAPAPPHRRSRSSTRSTTSISHTSRS